MVFGTCDVMPVLRTQCFPIASRKKRRGSGLQISVLDVPVNNVCIAVSGTEPKEMVDRGTKTVICRPDPGGRTVTRAWRPDVVVNSNHVSPYCSRRKLKVVSGRGRGQASRLPLQSRRPPMSHRTLVAWSISRKTGVSRIWFIRFGSSVATDVWSAQVGIIPLCRKSSRVL